MRSSDVTTAPGAFADVAALRACWHPVAFGHDVADRPVHADLLGEPLVLWRGPDRGPRANSDLCVHRGTALSLGWITGDELVCPYHGWRYRADGRCAAIPQLEDPSRVPAKARIGAFGCQERYGLIWVALAEGTRAGGRRVDGGDGRAVPVALRRRPPGGELHRLRALPVGAPGPAGRPRTACGAQARGPHRGKRSALFDRPAGAAQPRRLP